MECPPHPDGSTLFCPECGKPRHPLRDVADRIVGGFGPNSPNHRVQEFWQTGDPDVFAKDPGA